MSATMGTSEMKEQVNSIPHGDPPDSRYPMKVKGWTQQ